MINRLVTYDLRNERNYERICKAISALGPGPKEQQLRSVWLLESSQSAQALLENLRSAIDADDGLLVAEVTNWAGVNRNPERTARALQEALGRRD